MATITTAKGARQILPVRKKSSPLPPQKEGVSPPASGGEAGRGLSLGMKLEKPFPTETVEFVVHPLRIVATILVWHALDLWVS